MAAPEELLKLKLLIDTERKKVIFAKADKDFVDILFTFLSMPLGSIIHILNKQSSLGCLDKLYESIENLEKLYFTTKECKQMLLKPLNASRDHCDDSILGINASKLRTFFSCKKHAPRTNFFSDFTKFCGLMDMLRGWKTKECPGRERVFLRGRVNFIVSDDLCVIPNSTANLRDVLDKYGVYDMDDIKETCLELDANMVHNLLRRSLISKSPLSDVYFQETDRISVPSLRSYHPKVGETDINKNSKKMKATVIISKSHNMVLCMEPDASFLDLVVRFLDLPLAFTHQLSNKFSSIGCIGNLHKSLNDLFSNTKFIKPAALNLLANLKLNPYHMPSCFINKTCKVNPYHMPSCFINKTCKVGTDCTYGVEGSHLKLNAATLTLTDDLQIKSSSSDCIFQILRKHNVEVDDIYFKEIIIDETDAQNLLVSCLNFENPLDDVFLLKKAEKMIYYDD